MNRVANEKREVVLPFFTMRLEEIVLALEDTDVLRTQVQKKNK